MLEECQLPTQITKMEIEPGLKLMDAKEKHKVCRICINIIEGKYYSLFEKYNGLLTPDSCLNNVFISDRIRECTNVDITENDGLSSFICYSCLFELEDAYNFKRKCEKSDKILRSKPLVSTSVDPEEIHDNFEVSPAVKQENDSYCTESISGNHENNRRDEECELSEINKDEEDFSCDNEVERVKDEMEYEESLSPAYSEPEGKYVDPEPSQISNNDLKSEAKVKPYAELECNDCGKVFKSKCKIRVHIKKEHSTFTCPCCKLIFKTCQAFNNHKKVRSRACLSFETVRVEGEGKSQIFYCKNCDYSSKIRQCVINHTVVHTRIANFKCGPCNLSFLRRNALRIHEERVHNKLSGEKVCHKCGTTVVGFVAYIYHMRAHRRFSKNYQCDICDKKFNTRTKIINHLQEHKGPQVFSCDKCNRSYKSIYTLYSHKIQSHSDTKYSYDCKICGRIYRTKYAMKNHEKRHKLYEFSCSSCGQFFVRETDLDEHNKKHHSVRPYQCSECSKDYLTKKNLFGHIRQKHRDC